MNKLEGHISRVEVSGSMALVTVKISNVLSLKAIVIDTPDTAAYLVEGHPVKALFKETEVVLGLYEDHRISLQNRIEGKVLAVEKGQLLSRVRISTEAGEIRSVISTASAEKLELLPQAPVYAMVKLTEMMLSE